MEPAALDKLLRMLRLLAWRRVRDFDFAFRDACLHKKRTDNQNHGKKKKLVTVSLLYTGAVSQTRAPQSHVYCTIPFCKRVQVLQDGFVDHRVRMLRELIADRCCTL